MHESEAAQKRDIGVFPSYANARALICTDFRYFGSRGTDDWKLNARHLKRLVENLGQKHRVNHNRAIRDELLQLKDAVWKRFDKRINGTPLHASLRKTKCNPSNLPVVSTKPPRTTTSAKKKC